MMKNLLRKILLLLSDNTLYLPSLVGFCFAWGCLGLTTLFFYGSYLQNEQKKIDHVLLKLEEKSHILQKNHRQRECYHRFFAKRDRTFLQNVIEPVVLGKSSKDFLSRLDKSQTNGFYQPIQERINFLENPDNQLRFLKKDIQNSPHYEEIYWTLENPVFLDFTEIVEILSHIEGQQENTKNQRPQMFVKNISINNMSAEKKMSLLCLDMQVVQRTRYGLSSD